MNPLRLIAIAGLALYFFPLVPGAAAPQPLASPSLAVVPASSAPAEPPPAATPAIAADAAPSGDATAPVQVEVPAPSRETRHEKLVRLTELQGMKGMISQQEEIARAQFARQLSGILEELKAQRGFTDDDPRWEALITAARELMVALGNAISVDPAIEKWIELYGTGLADSDIDQILEFYESKAGKKDVEAASGALPKWTEYMMEESQRVVESGIDKFMKEVEKAIGEVQATPEGK